MDIETLQFFIKITLFRLNAYSFYLSHSIVSFLRCLFIGYTLFEEN